MRAVEKYLIAFFDRMEHLSTQPFDKRSRQNDGAGCGSSPWDAGDFDPYHGKISVTDRYIKCFNIILEEVQKEYPDVGIAVYDGTLLFRS